MFATWHISDYNFILGAIDCIVASLLGVARERNAKILHDPFRINRITPSE